MSELDTPRGKLDIGKVMADLFRVLGHNFVAFLVLSLILTGIPGAIVGYFQAETVRNDASNFGFNLILSGLVAAVSGAVLQGALMQGTVSDMNGRKVSLGEILAAGLRAFLPLIGIGILMAIALFFGFILLIVPGVMMALAWCVTTPAYIAENRGVFESFSRSAQLTRNNRWRILGLALIYFVAIVVVGLIVSALTGVMSLAGANAVFIQQVVVSPIFSSLYAMVGATGGAVLYVELRRLKEGLGPDSLAAIFD